MTTRQRLIRAVAGLALLLMGPAVLAVATYRASVRLDQALPALEEDLTAVIDKLRLLPIDCRPAANSPGRLPVQRFWVIREGLATAEHRVGMAAFSVDDDAVFWAMKLHAPGTDGLRALYEFGALSDYLSLFRIRESICVGQEWLEGDELQEEEQRSQAVIDAFRQALEEFRPKLAAAREQYERDRPILKALAWSLGLFELIGLPLFAVIAWKDLRAWRARRRS